MKNNSNKLELKNRQSVGGDTKNIFKYVLNVLVLCFALNTIASNPGDIFSESTGNELTGIESIALAESQSQTPAAYCYSDFTADYRGGGSAGTVYIQGEPVGVRFTNGRSKIKDQGSYININPNLVVGESEVNYYTFVMTFSKPITDLDLDFHDVTYFRNFNIKPTLVTESLEMRASDGWIKKRGGAVNEGGHLVWTSIAPTKEIRFDVSDPGSRHVDLVTVSFNYTDCDIAASISGQDITCATAGSISVNISSSGSYSYQFGKAGSSLTSVGSVANIPVSESGNYQVIVTDSAKPDSKKILNQTINYNSAAGVGLGLVGKEDTSCKNSVGKIVVAGSGGSGSYQYQIKNTSANWGTTWSNSGTFDNLSEGSYNIKVIDSVNVNCEEEITESISYNNQFDVSIVITNKTKVSCLNPTAEFTAQASGGGSGTLEYRIKEKIGGTWSSWSGQTQYTGLIAAIYQIEARDPSNTNCFNAQETTIETENSNISLAINGDRNVYCHLSTTNLQPTITGGSGNYEYQIEDLDNSVIGMNWSDATSFTNFDFKEGNYSIKARDASNSNCEIQKLEEIKYSNQYDVQASIQSQTKVSCLNPTAEMIVAASGGESGNFKYQIREKDGGAWSAWSSSNKFEGLVEKVYEIRVEDASNQTCFKMIEATILPEDNNISASIDGRKEVFCDLPTTSIQVIGAGGSGVYEFQIKKSDELSYSSVWNTSNNFENLSDGTYNIRIKDKQNELCIIELTQVITYNNLNDVIASIQSQTKVSCKNPTAEVIVAASGGKSGVLNYRIKEEESTNWSEWSTETKYDGLIAKTYDIEIVDPNNTGCFIAIKTTIETEDLSIEANIAPPAMVTCLVPRTDIVVNGEFGTGEYQYQIKQESADWNDSNWTTTNIFNKGAGKYDLKIRDLNNFDCEIERSVEVVYNNEFDLSAEKEKMDITCDEPTGVIEIKGQQGGNGAFLYSKDGGATWQDLPRFENLERGSYPMMMKSKNEGECELDLGIAEILYLDYEVGYEKAEISVTLDKKNLEVNEGENAVFQSKTLIRSTTLPNGSEEVPSDFITYQWYLGDPSLSGIALMDNSTYSGTDTSELTITEVEEEFHNNQYFVIATHEKNNCIEDVSGVTLAVYCISVYNKFTPNNDGINDNFTIKCLDHHPNNSLEIYNRWGDLVYKKKEYGTDSQKSSKTSISHSTSDQNSWDGTSNNGVVFFKNQSLPVGTYYYMIDFGDGREPKIGWVYLNR